jgi:hypothetical protein
MRKLSIDELQERYNVRRARYYKAKSKSPFFGEVKNSKHQFSSVDGFIVSFKRERQGKI